MLLFLIELDISNKGTVPLNRREFTLPPSPEMVLDGARQMHKVETPWPPWELGHEYCKILSASGKAEEEQDLPRLIWVTCSEKEHHTPLQKPHLPA